LLTTSSTSPPSSELDRSAFRAVPPTDDEPVHPKPRNLAPVEQPAASTDDIVAAAPAVTEPTADGHVADGHVAGDTVVASSAVGSNAAAPHVVEPTPVAAPAAPPAEPALRARPVVRAERLASPVLVAKVVPVAKAIPTAEPVVESQPAPVAMTVAAPTTIVAIASAKSTTVDDLDPSLVPLTALGRGLWHIRNFLIATNVSMLVHAAILIALGSIVHHSPAKPKLKQPPLEFAIETAIVKKPEPPKIETIVIAPVAKEPNKKASQGSGAGSDGSQGGSGGGDFGGLNLNPIKIDTVAKLTTGGSGLGTDKAYGNDMLAEVGEALDPKDAKADFFGVEAKGRNFVFVVDTSGSMSTNNRYERCRAELLRSVGALKYGQKYFVVFFNHTTFAMPERKLVDARPAQITKTQEWCKLAVPSGGTDPADGLMMALKLKPDAIYLLTDGDFDPAVVQRLNHAQPQTKKIPIHTICFESVSGAPVMEAIAKLTGATYQYIAP
jgi:hypothetical protein